MDKISPEVILIVTSIFTLGMMGIYLFLQWQKRTAMNQREQNNIVQKQFEMQAMREQNSQKQMVELMARLMDRTGPEKREASHSDNAGPNSGGYIIFDMPDANKSMFHDLLKGFEDFAKLRGYVIHFSIDNAFPNKVAFKFTLEGNGTGINVSSGQVRKDIREYIERVRRGESLDDLPVVISPEEHGLVLACLKNRISLIEHNYNLEKTAKEFYAGLLKQIPSIGLGAQQPQNFYLQAGTSNQASSYLAQNSPQAALGVGNRLIENSLDQSIHIASSFNERKAQVDALSDLWMALYHYREAKKPEGEEKEKISEAVESIRKAQTELEEQDPPEPNRIRKWLETAKATILALGLTKEVTDAAKAVWDAFQMSS
jgi:hypothetical protein